MFSTGNYMIGNILQSPKNLRKVEILITYVSIHINRQHVQYQFLEADTVNIDRIIKG